MVSSNMDTQGSCQSNCCDTEIISEVSSSSSDSVRTHASHHVKSRPSFETLPPQPVPFLLLMPAWVAKGAFWRAFLRQLAAIRQRDGPERRRGVCIRR